MLERERDSERERGGGGKSMLYSFLLLTEIYYYDFV